MADAAPASCRRSTSGRESGAGACRSSTYHTRGTPALSFSERDVPRTCRRITRTIFSVSARTSRGCAKNRGVTDVVGQVCNLPRTSWKTCPTRYPLRFWWNHFQVGPFLCSEYLCQAGMLTTAKGRSTNAKHACIMFLRAFRRIERGGSRYTGC